MILFCVDFQTVMALELLGTEFAVIDGREVWMDSLYVLPHVVHVPTPLATQPTDDTSTTVIHILLAVGLHVAVSVLPI